jgi:hypothetical protein
MADGTYLYVDENVVRHINEHRRMLETESLLLDFITEEKEAFDAFDVSFFDLLREGDLISVNVVESPSFNSQNVFKIASFKDPTTPVLVAIEDMHQVWESMYLKELDQFEKQGIHDNSLKLYKIKKFNSLKYIFSE